MKVACFSPGRFENQKLFPFSLRSVDHSVFLQRLKGASVFKTESLYLFLGNSNDVTHCYFLKNARCIQEWDHPAESRIPFFYETVSLWECSEGDIIQVWAQPILNRCADVHRWTEVSYAHIPSVFNFFFDPVFFFFKDLFVKRKFPGDPIAKPFHYLNLICRSGNFEIQKVLG